MFILTYNIHVHTTPTRKQVTYVKESHGDLLSTCFQEYKKKVLYIQLQLTNSKQTCFHPSGPPKVTSQSQFCRLQRLPILLICWVSYTKCCTTVVVKCFYKPDQAGTRKDLNLLWWMIKCPSSLPSASQTQTLFQSPYYCRAAITESNRVLM